ncbi:MerR family transcriptional regulator [Fusobacterium ulcerans]|uniref:MerR family transcriptional regulator n=1 Tax=Fusobacterium ulcerans TaxID=861 RepID=UPI002671C480|nr:MerR family transcriptional regulator [Fusobacterium ulcerans]
MINLSIGEAAKKLNTTTHTLRYYDNEGLLPIERDVNGRRIFSTKNFIMLNTIECLKATGMSLKDIKLYIDWCEEGFASVQRRHALFLERKATVESQIAALQKTLKTINYKIDLYENALNTGVLNMCEADREELANKILNDEL